MATRLPLGAALLTIALAGTARAQVEEITPPPATPAPPPTAAPAAPAPEAAPPPAAPAPPPVRLTRYSRYRTSWYIGFGLGGGGGWVSSDGFEDTESEGGVAFLAKVGWVARPWLLVGAEVSFWRHDEDRYWVQYNHYDVMATFFPMHDNGFYGKVGAGAGVAMIGAIEILGVKTEAETDTGLDLKLGLGYEWQLSTSFNLGADLAYGVTVYDGGRTHDLTVAATCTWY